MMGVEYYIECGGKKFFIGRSSVDGNMDLERVRRLGDVLEDAVLMGEREVIGWLIQEISEEVSTVDDIWVLFRVMAALSECEGKARVVHD